MKKQQTLKTKIMVLVLLAFLPLGGIIYLLSSEKDDSNWGMFLVLLGAILAIIKTILNEIEDSKKQKIKT
jgi:hypothetical protein